MNEIRWREPWVQVVSDKSFVRINLYHGPSQYHYVYDTAPVIWLQHHFHAHEFTDLSDFDQEQR